MPVPSCQPDFLSLPSLALITPLCVAGAVIGTELIATLGITTNTALLGALAGMGLARLPFSVFARYRSPHLQNLAACRSEMSAVLGILGILAQIMATEGAGSACGGRDG